MVQDFLPKFCGELSLREANAVSPIALAFVGDAVQTLFVRTVLLCNGASSLHKATNAHVAATAQSRVSRLILPLLTDAETDVFKRCRNAKTKNFAKSASVTDYRAATGLEGLIGHLYLTGKHERLAELLRIALDGLSGDGRQVPQEENNDN